MHVLLLVLADSFRTSPTPFIAMMLGGFAVGAFGYLYGSRLIVGVGVAMIFLSTLLIPLALNIGR
jgi:phosphate/sulfate permease